MLFHTYTDFNGRPSDLGTLLPRNNVCVWPLPGRELDYCSCGSRIKVMAYWVRYGIT